ncbi:hypothetical protein ZIOFF_063293 [Zingiber officinale]|uniref:Uncharacterized protein n=1 Tax=Zingiber officinale TaxID=94328 RepID=A0A8J5KG31_ZINOF|nr:hypothetical protein ZIOFF_063293 [Zingiber officinale]
MRHPLGLPFFRRKHRRFIILLFAVASTAFFLLLISSRPVEPSDALTFFSHVGDPNDVENDTGGAEEVNEDDPESEEGVVVMERADGGASCATVEKMGEAFAASSERESLRVRELIERHFNIHGAATVRDRPPGEFCRHGFVIGKASEAGFGNEMYKILTAAALSVMLNRSLIIGQTRYIYLPLALFISANEFLKTLDLNYLHFCLRFCVYACLVNCTYLRIYDLLSLATDLCIWQQYPFGDYISFTNHSFTLKEVKHLWRKHDCAGKYGRKLVMRIDNFAHPMDTNVLCSNWKGWKHPIIWFQGTTDAVAIQFFLKNVHPEMRNAALLLFGPEESLRSRPNVFGELLRVIISPSSAIEEAVNQVLQGIDPDIVLHMRMMSNRPIRAIQAAVQCIKKALSSFRFQFGKPRVALVSDTPSFVKDITPFLLEFAEVVHFDYSVFQWNSSIGSMTARLQSSDFRAKDWGPAPRWVAFVDFFLASRAKHAVVSGAHRRVGTTFAQLVAALAAANQNGKHHSASNFSFFSSFHSNLLVDGLKNQIGWGHIWNRFGGPLSCPHQAHQCALSPLLPPAWWDGEWQSPIARDIQRLKEFGVGLSESGKIVQTQLHSFCQSRKDYVKTLRVFEQ